MAEPQHQSSAHPIAGNKNQAEQEQGQRGTDDKVARDSRNAAPRCPSTGPSVISLASPQSPSLVAAKSGYIGPDKPHRPGHSVSVPAAAHPTTIASPLAPGHDATIALTTNSSSPVSQTEEFPPLHMGSVLPGTKIAHPKPITLPNTASSTPLPVQDHEGLSQGHQHHYHPNQHYQESIIRSSAFSGNVAQLEATAERLSTGTSSIGDAIRDLHGELKRSDSRRSSKLAASLRAQGEDNSTDAVPLGQLKRHLSNASSIVATNIAARQGGYSPGGFVLSPTHSLTGRLRSGSKDSTGRPDLDNQSLLSRHGPGKASVRSVRSTKLFLAEISESEPTSLTKDALDAADLAPPLEDDQDDNDVTIRPEEHDEDELLRSNSFQKMLDQALRSDGDDWDSSGRAQHATHEDGDKPQRPPSAQSFNTFEQAMNAFADFDGVYYEPDQDWAKEQRHAHFANSDNTAGDANVPTRYSPPPEMVQPQSYVDPDTGQQMLYYPARVPAMLNLPPKLSHKPKAVQRQNRRSQVLSAMVDSNKASETNEAKRKSGVPDISRDSFLPDPLAGHRGSFIALSQDGLPGAVEDDPAQRQEPEPEAEKESPAESTALRRPKRLSQMPGVTYEGHKSKASLGNALPPQLRASAFFDLPPSAAPEVEAKQGSAMATLDSMLDASTRAPVNAFTNNAFGGHVGDEVYGKENKKKNKQHKPKASSSSLQPEAANTVAKKRSSRSWFRRGSSYNSADKSDTKDSRSRSRSPSALGDMNREVDATETQALSSNVDDKSVKDGDENREEDSDAETTDEDLDYSGQPTTLLAELQLRKKKAKQRTQPREYGQAAHMTLLEMDAVAETERKNRKNKRVNLAWEDPDAHQDQNGSDDEDVPLAIIAAKHQGAKNMADLERPIGLMERREMEDNEPLSQRRSRLQGLGPTSIALPKRQSMATLSAHLGGNIITPSSLSRSPAKTPEPEEPEIEEETLGARKKRLETKELPKARPVSSAFSAELLSQFGDREESSAGPAQELNKGNSTPTPAAQDLEEETLGQRRRRLQAEREAREREMSYSNLVGGPSTPAVNRRLSMADMLAAHPKKDNDTRAQREKARIEQEYYAARSQEAKMAALRSQQPTNLYGPGTERSGGFRGGLYNDGLGGLAGQATRSTSALNTQGFGHMQMHNRSSTALSAYGMPMAQQNYAQSNYGAMNRMSAMNNMNAMGGYNAMQHSHPYAGSAMQLPLQMEMPAQVNTASMKRIDQWRHGVMP